MVTTEKELASFAGECSIQEQIAQSILKGNDSSSDEVQTSGWTFKAREWNEFEAYYLEAQQNQSLKEVAPVVVAKEKTAPKKDYLETHFEETQAL